MVPAISFACLVIAITVHYYIVTFNQYFWYSTPLVFSAVNNLPMGYPVLQQPPMPAAGQPHLDSLGCGISSCHVVNGVPAPGNFHPMQMNSGNE